MLSAFSAATWSMTAAAIAALAISLPATVKDVGVARGIDRIAALAGLCFAMSLAVFGAEHFAAPQSLLPLVPSYMPWRMFWVYFVGAALIAASLSIATKIQVRWSGLLVGIMMYLFVLMLYLPSALTEGGRIVWTIVFRESSFGSGGWVLAGIAMSRAPEGRGSILIRVGRVLIGMTSIFFGVQHFLHPLGLPAVPLEREMPTWVPARAVIDYLTGAFLIASGVCFLIGHYTRTAAAYVGAWIVFLVLVIYGPVLAGALVDAKPDAQMEGLNYFFDTLLFGGSVLSLAAADKK